MDELYAIHATKKSTILDLFVAFLLLLYTLLSMWQMLV